VGFTALVPLAEKWIPGIWAHVTAAAVILTLLAPFLRAMMIKHNKSEEFTQLWDESKANRAPLVASVVIRMLIAMGFVFYVLARLFHISVLLILLLALLTVGYMIFSRWTKRSSRRLEETFMSNLRSRELRAEQEGKKKPEYATRLLDKDLHLAVFDVPAEVEWAGKELRELSFGQRYGVQVVSIMRGQRRINIPQATTRLFPQDRIQVIGTDKDLEVFGTALMRHQEDTPETWSNNEMILRRLPIKADSSFVGKTLLGSGIRDQHHCMVAGIEKSDGTLHVPNAHLPLEDGDVLWLVGEEKDIDGLLSL